MPTLMLQLGGYELTTMKLKFLHITQRRCSGSNEGQP